MPDPNPWARPPQESETPTDSSAHAVAPVPAVTDAPVTNPAGPPASHSHPYAGQPLRAPAVAGGASAGWAVLIPVAGIMAIAVIALAAALAAYVQRDTGHSYTEALDDDDYLLDAMSLRNRDMPAGLKLVSRVEFTNEEWAEATRPDDPERALAQLNSQGRIRNNVAIFSWGDSSYAHLAETLNIISQSTLYATADDARAELGRLCGLYIDERQPLVEFAVPKLGEQSVGFYVTTEAQDFSATIETVVCFRTGRIVHGVMQTAFQGAHDIALTVRLAERMLARVDETFRGAAVPLDTPANQGG